MSKKYLFSPIGNTDPIKYLRDGSMLHICRYYKPDVVYMYLSKEMIETHKKDNRYVRTLELLGKNLQHEFEIHVIENETMSAVQQYDVFYSEFYSIIEKIEAGMEEEDSLLVNMASGTPAMKSALLVMATLAEYRFLPIQVSTPKKQSNLEHEERKDYDVLINWELNEDNEEGTENRCEEVRCMNLVRLLKIDIIKKHLCAYDYHAALRVGKEIRRDISNISYYWLETAAARSVLDWDKMNRVIPEKNGILRPIKKDNIKNALFEYALILDLKVKRGEYADFVRAITPLGVDLLELILEEYCSIEIKKYYRFGMAKWDEKKLFNTEILDILNNNFIQFKCNSPVYSTHLNCIIQEKCSDSKLAKRTQELVDLEHNIRNIAAHQIVTVTPEWIKEKTNKSLNEIMGLIKNICESLKINSTKARWESYNMMNDRIIEELEKY